MSPNTSIRRMFVGNINQDMCTQSTPDVMSVKPVMYLWSNAIEKYIYIYIYIYT